MKEKPKIQSFISLKMVQRKVSNIKLGFQANTNTLKTEKNQAYTSKTSLNNHDINKSKRADSKAIKMMKSRFSDANNRLQPPCNHNEPPCHPEKPPHLITPTPNKPPQCNPNYMKSTSSFEARKEKTAKMISSISTTQKLAKTLTKSASFKKATRNLKRVPSLKLKQNTKTSSSTQKDKKFPPYLKLKPGATEAKGKSVHRVCSYSYCSLNGDHHNNSARTPLKKFMYSRQKQLKSDMVDHHHNNEEFFVDIFVPNTVVDQVSESLSDGPCSEIDLQDNQMQFQDTELKSSSLEDEDYKPSSSVQSLDEFCSDKSDLVWEEGQMFTSNDMNENDQVCIQNDYNNDYDDNLGFEYSPYFHDEIVEYLCYSDAASIPDSESTQTGEKDDVERPNMIKEKVEMECRNNDEDEVAKKESSLEYEAKVNAIKLTEESTDKQDEILSEIIEETSETDSSESDEDKSIIREIREIREQNSFDIQKLTDKLETLCTKEEDSNEVLKKIESETNQEELHNSCKKVVMRCRKADEDDEDDEEDKEFNPRGPNFLELEPDPEAEKVDLRHQEMDERRNAEEWMLDHALRKTVNQLSPARKKKVALLVEAFETVLPVSKNDQSDNRRDSLGYELMIDA